MPDDNPEHCGISDAADKGEDKPSFRLPPFLLVTAVSAVLCFYGLGTRTLWEDEGETAVLAQRALCLGIPKALSGNNLVYQNVSNSYDKTYRWIFHPWGQFYVTAASLAVFGQTAFAARFPFALCGVLTVALLYVFIWRHWRSSVIAFLGAMLLAASVAFIIHCRQCRYYGLSSLTALIVVAVFIEVVNKPSWRWWIGLAMALAAQFYADFGTLMVMLPGLLLSLWPMKVGKKELIAAAKGFALAFLLIIPGLVLHWEKLTVGGEVGHNFFVAMLKYIHYFDVWFIPLLFAVPAGGVFIWRLFRSRKGYISEQERIVIVCCLVILSAAVGMAKVAPVPFMRYIVPQMSLAKLLLALILVECYNLLCSKYLPSRPSKLLSTIIIIIVAFTYFFAAQEISYRHADKYSESRLPPQSEPFVRIKFADFVSELTHDFVCCNRVALNAVDDLAETGETVVIYYGDLPLMFYRPDLKVYTLSAWQNSHSAPDLIISADNSFYGRDIKAHLQKMQAQYGYSYDSITISVPDVVFGNIPEPQYHYFITPSTKVAFRVYLRSDHKDRINKLPRTVEALESRWYRSR